MDFYCTITRQRTVQSPVAGQDWAEWLIQHHDGLPGEPRRLLHEETFTGTYAQAADRDEAWKAKQRKRQEALV